VPEKASGDQFRAEDPTTRHPTPGSGEKEVEHPGLTGEMDVRPDHGERTYRLGPAGHRPHDQPDGGGASRQLCSGA
jgi:hypothetical protein